MIKDGEIDKTFDFHRIWTTKSIAVIFYLPFIYFQFNDKLFDGHL